MAACTRCGFQQIGTQAYCERCGLFLPALAIYKPVSPDSDVPSSPPTPLTPPTRRTIAIEDSLTARMIAERCMRECLAILGLLVASVGVYGCVYGIMGPQVAFSLGILFLIGGTVFMTIRLFVQKLSPRLQRSQRIVGWAITTAVAFMLFLIVPEVPQTTKLLMDIGFGTLFFFYGLTLAVLALW